MRLGIGLSPVVDRAATDAVDRVLALLATLSSERTSGSRRVPVPAPAVKSPSGVGR